MNVQDRTPENHCHDHRLRPPGLFADNRRYYDANSRPHGFVRDSGGTITTFDGPGVTTSPISINPSGAIAGYYEGAQLHGFVRDPGGAITTFDVPGAAGTGQSRINPSGAIAGIYYDASFTPHGFMRDPRGAITTFDVPGAIETDPFSINPSGAITGGYLDASFVPHGFVLVQP